MAFAADASLAIAVDTRKAEQGMRAFRRGLQTTGKAARTLQNTTQTAFKRVGEQAKKASNDIGSMRKAVFSVRTAITALAGSLGGGKLISVASKFESLKTSLISVTGSVEEANEAFRFIQKTAAGMPISVAQLTESFITLKASGITPTTELLTVFSDAASITTDKVATLDAMTRVFSRGVQGGLGLEELTQIAEKGLPVWRILEEKLGLTRLELTDFGQSADGAKKILLALSQGINEEFGGATARALGTAETKMSNFGDALDRTLETIAVNSGILDAFKEFLDKITQALPNIGTVATVVFTSFSEHISTTLSILKEFYGALFAAGKGNFDQAAEGFKKAFENVRKEIDLIVGFPEKLKNAIEDTKVKDAINNLLDPTFSGDGTNKPGKSSGPLTFRKIGIAPPSGATAPGDADAAKDAISAIRESNIELQNEIKLVGLDEKAQALLNNQFEHQAILREHGTSLTREQRFELIKLFLARREATLELFKAKKAQEEKEKADKAEKDEIDAIKEIYKASIPPMDQYITRMERLNQLQREGKITSAEYKAATEDARQTLEDTDPILRGLKNEMNSFTDSMIDGALEGKKFGESLKESFKDLIGTILKEIVRLVSSSAFKQLSGGGGSSGGGLFGGILKSFFGAFTGGAGAAGGSSLGSFASFGGGGVSNSGSALLSSGAGSSFSSFSFASGGSHSGGLRIVGERGPELEATGPSRIYSAQKTREMLSGGGGVVIQMDLRGSNGDASIEAAVERGIRRAAPNIIDRSVKKVQSGRQRDPAFFGAKGR